MKETYATLTKIKDGIEFVTFVEFKKYPFYLSLFHPEKFGGENEDEETKKKILQFRRDVA